MLHEYCQNYLLIPRTLPFPDGKQPNLCQLYVVCIYLIPCNIFFEAHDMIQMEAKRRERWARYRTQRLAEQSLKSKATHLKGADPVRHKLPLRLSLLSALLVIQDWSFPSHSTYYHPEFMPLLYITNNQSAHIIGKSIYRNNWTVVPPP